MPKQATKRQPPSRLDHDPVRLRRQRIAAGLSVAEAATLAGISGPMWSQLEHGRRNASAATLKRCAEALGVRPEQLMPAVAA